MFIRWPIKNAAISEGTHFAREHGSERTAHFLVTQVPALQNRAQSRNHPRFARVATSEIRCHPQQEAQILGHLAERVPIAVKRLDLRRAPTGLHAEGAADGHRREKTRPSGLGKLPLRGARPP